MLTAQQLIDHGFEATDGAPSMSGVGDLDLITGGFAPGRIWLALGGPQSGRTTLALQIARLGAEAGIDTVLLGGADPIGRLSRMLTASITRAPRGNVQTSPAAESRSRASAHASRLPLAVVPHAPPGLAHRAAGDFPAGLVVIDDLDLWGASPDELLHALHSMAAGGRRVVATAPASTASSLSPPQVTAWARACTGILRLQRHEHGARAGEIDLHLLTHRDGPLSTIAAVFVGAYASIEDLPRAP